MKRIVVRRVALAIGLAICTTYLTAWVFSAWPVGTFTWGTGSARSTTPRSSALRVSPQPRSGVYPQWGSRIVVTPRPPDVSRRTGVQRDSKESFQAVLHPGGQRRPEEPTPEWAPSMRRESAWSVEPDGRLKISCIEHQAAGWPALAVRCDYEVVLRQDSQTSELELVSTKSGVVMSPDRWGCIPMTQEWSDNIRTIGFVPVWPGFMINTLFYLCVWLVLNFNPLLIRRLWRWKRGRCLGCGYELRLLTASECPECGQAIDQPLAPAASSGAGDATLVTIKETAIPECVERPDAKV